MNPDELHEYHIPGSILDCSLCTSYRKDDREGKLKQRETTITVKVNVKKPEKHDIVKESQEKEMKEWLNFKKEILK